MYFFLYPYFIYIYIYSFFLGRVGDVGKCSVCDVKCSVRLGSKLSVVGVSRVNQTLHHTTKSREAPRPSQNVNESNMNLR
jgi:hypothetical protein